MKVEELFRRLYEIAGSEPNRDEAIAAVKAVLVSLMHFADQEKAAAQMELMYKQITQVGGESH